MTPREQLLKMQRIILRELKESVHRLQGVLPTEVTRYSQAYLREFKNYQKISSKRELLGAIKESDIVFGADFHPFNQSQRTHLRLLRELVKGKRKVVLALEAIDSQFQKDVDRYMKGVLTDQAFLKKIHYSDAWGFPWENYKVLFDFAKLYKIPIYGINETHKSNHRPHDLKRRDAHSAEIISQLRRKFSKDLIYVIYGDLHLASNHLPKLTRGALGGGPATKFLTIFQNAENLYFKLARQKLEERVDVLKLRPDVYCIVNSPPWLKWQAYLQFLEQRLDLESGEDISDYNDDMSQMVGIIKQLWDVRGDFADFSVYTHRDMGIAEYLATYLNKKDLNRVISLIRREKSFFLPHPPVFYLKSFEVNHSASLAGQYIHAKLRREKKAHFNFPKDFSGQIWIQAIGFFASKMVNNRRKFSSLRDLPTTRQTTLLVLEQKLLEELSLKAGKNLRNPRRNKFRRNLDFLEAAHLLGAQLGNRLYIAFSRGDLSAKTLQSWLKTPVDGTPGFSKFYIHVLERLKKVSSRERSKDERL